MITPGTLNALKEDMLRYIAKNYYNGFGLFHFLGFDCRSGGIVYSHFLLSPGAIDEVDKKWEEGFRELGIKHGLELRLSKEVYAES